MTPHPARFSAGQGGDMRNKNREDVAALLCTLAELQHDLAGRWHTVGGNFAFSLAVRANRLAKKLLSTASKKRSRRAVKKH